MFHPSSIDLFLTQDCNLRCPYCYIPKFPQVMIEPTWKHVIDWFYKNGIPKNNYLKTFFFGGEPLLEFDRMRSIIQYVESVYSTHPAKMGFGVTTNGTVFNDEIENYLIQKHIGITISCDGVEASQNQNRPTKCGGGSYVYVSDTIKRLVQRKIQFTVRLTYTASNVHSLASNIFHLWDLGCRSVFPAPAVNTSWGEEELNILRQQLEEICSRILTFDDKTYKRCGNIEKKIRRYHEKILNNRGRIERPCGAGFKYLAVDCDGKIYPCHRFVGMREEFMGDVFGNCNKTRCNAWKRFKASSVFPTCDSCPSSNLCTSGCYAINHAETGSIFLHGPKQCSLLRTEDAVIIEFYQKLLNNPVLLETMTKLKR